MKESNSKYSSLIHEIEAQKNLDRAMRHLEKGDFLLNEMDVVAQDEFSHDVLIPLAERPHVLILSVT